MIIKKKKKKKRETLKSHDSARLDYGKGQKLNSDKLQL